MYCIPKVLKANSCVSSGNMFSAATVLCTAELPCSVSFYAKSAGASTQVWQGFANDFPGAHSWVVTPGPTDATKGIDYSDSYVDSKGLLLPGDKWRLVQYVYPNKNDPMIHKWNSEGGHFTGLRMMVEANGDDCGSVMYDDFCVCRTTYAEGVKWCCGPTVGTAGQCNNAAAVGSKGGLKALDAILVVVIVGAGLFTAYRHHYGSGNTVQYAAVVNDDDFSLNDD